MFSDLNGEKFFWTFHQMELQKNKSWRKSLELKKYLRDKLINYMLNGKTMIILLILGL